MAFAGGESGAPGEQVCFLGRRPPHSRCGRHGVAVSCVDGPTAAGKPQAETRVSPPGVRGLATIPEVCCLPAGFSLSEAHTVWAVGPSGPVGCQDPPSLTHHGAQRGAHQGPHSNLQCSPHRCWQSPEIWHGEGRKSHPAFNSCVNTALSGSEFKLTASQPVSVRAQPTCPEAAGDGSFPQGPGDGSPTGDSPGPGTDSA